LSPAQVEKWAERMFLQPMRDIRKPMKEMDESARQTGRSTHALFSHASA
jgi:hypothetical protein